MGAEFLGPLRSLDDILNPDHIHDHLKAIIHRRFNAFFDSRVGSDAQHAGNIRPCLGRGLHLGPPGIHCLKIGDDHVVRESFPQFPDSVKPFALDEGRTSLQPVCTAGDGFFRRLERTAEVDEVQCYLQYRFHSFTLAFSSSSDTLGCTICFQEVVSIYSLIHEEVGCYRGVHHLPVPGIDNGGV